MFYNNNNYDNRMRIGEKTADLMVENNGTIKKCEGCKYLRLQREIISRRQILQLVWSREIKRKISI